MIHFLILFQIKTQVLSRHENEHVSKTSVFYQVTNIKAHLGTVEIVGWEHPVERRHGPHPEVDRCTFAECALYPFVSWSLGCLPLQGTVIHSTLCLGCQPDCGPGMWAACVPRGT